MRLHCVKWSCTKQFSTLHIWYTQVKSKQQLVQCYGRPEVLGLQHWASSHRAVGKAREQQQTWWLTTRGLWCVVLVMAVIQGQASKTGLSLWQKVDPGVSRDNINSKGETTEIALPVPPNSPSGFSSKNPDFQYFFSIYYMYKKIIKCIKMQWDYHAYTALARKDSSNLVC